MRHLKTTLLLALLSLPALALGACADGDEPTAPVPVTSADGKKTTSTTTTKLVSPTTVTKETATAYTWEPVMRTMPIWEDIYDSQTIGSKGGTLTAGEVTLTIPRGALKEDTKLSMITLQGDKMYVLFWPHGLMFEVPATLSFSLDNTNGAYASDADLMGTYFESLFEAVPTVLEAYSVNKKGTIASFEIKHFSYYSVYLRRGYTAAGAD